MELFKRAYTDSLGCLDPVGNASAPLVLQMSSGDSSIAPKTDTPSASLPPSVIKKQRKKI